VTRSPSSAPQAAGDAPALADRERAVIDALRDLADRERAVIDALRDIEFGTVEVAIHNARIVQITRSQKFRFDEG